VILGVLYEYELYTEYSSGFSIFCILYGGTTQTQRLAEELVGRFMPQHRQCKGLVGREQRLPNLNY